MTHQPECPCNDTSAHPDGCLCCEVSSPCICDRLRACEERVLSLNPVATGVLIAQRARERALDAAREAVVERSMTSLGPAMQGSEWVHTPSVLAAIDALRGER